MLPVPSPLIRLPRALLEHPLPLLGSGISSHLQYSGSSNENSLFSLQLGLVDRWQRASPSSPGGAPSLSPGFTLDTFSLLCALFFLTERRSGVTLTFNQLFRALTGSRSLCSAHHRESLKTSLATLAAIDCCLTPLSAAPSPLASYHSLITVLPTVTAPVFGRVAPAFIIHFAPTVLQCLDDPQASALFHFGAFRSLRSRLARALYPALTSWAHYSRAVATRPFRITLSRLITHLGATPSRYLSQRRAFFHGHRRANILHSLHNLPTPHGFLQVSLTGASSVDDDLLSIWFTSQISQTIEDKEELKGVALETHERDSSSSLSNPPAQNSQSPAFSNSAPISQDPKGTSSFGREGEGQSPSPSPLPGANDPLSSFRHLKIYDAWKASGRDDKDFVSRVRSPSVTLSQDDLALLHAARIAPSRCENFLILSKKLLPQRTWLDLLGEAKYAALSHTPPTNPTGKLINEILASVRSAI